MRALSGTKVPDAVADPIIWQPSVRTMLLTQKAIAEGGRSMIYECLKLADVMGEHERKGEGKAAAAIDERLGFLTPILKGFLTEAGKEAADLGIQVYGGHGFIKDNKAEQVYRDVRIPSHPIPSHPVPSHPVSSRCTATSASPRCGRARLRSRRSTFSGGR